MSPYSPRIDANDQGRTDDEPANHTTQQLYQVDQADQLGHAIAAVGWLLILVGLVLAIDAFLKRGAGRHEPK